MSLSGWILVCLTISCAFASKSVVRRTALRSALNAATRKQSDLELNSPNYNGNLQAFKHREEQSDFDQLPDEELLNDYMRENGQEETIGDGFQNMHNSLAGVNQAYLEPWYQRLQLQNQQAPSSNFRERERSRTLGYGNPSYAEQREDALKELAEELMEEEAAENNRNYGLPKTIYEDPRYEYRLAAGESLEEPQLYNDRSDEDNLRNYYGQEQEYYSPLLPVVERRNVNGRYPLGRDFRGYKDLAKRFPVAKRSPKSMTRKRQITDPKVAQDLASLFGTQSTDSQSNTHQTTIKVQNHTSNHEEHTTPISTSTSTMLSKNSKEKDSAQLSKTKERILDVQKKSIDWSQYFGIDRRKKKAVLAAKPGSQNQDDAFFLQHYYSTMGDNLQTSKRNKDKELEEKLYKLQQIDNRLKNINDLALLEAILEGSPEVANSEEMREVILNKLAAAYSKQKIRQAIRDIQNSIIMQQQDSQFADNYPGIEDKHFGREEWNQR